jgi:propionyl-CoA carboxylase alpha chain
VLRAPKPRDEWVVVLAGHRRHVRIADVAPDLVVELLDEGRSLRLEDIDWAPGRPLLRAVLGDAPFAAEVTPAAEGFVIRHRAARERVLVLTPASAELHERLPPRKAADTSRHVLSPMPGLVVSLDVAAGDEVKLGQTLCVIEAMKMQNVIRAERDGVIKQLNVRAGDSVGADAVLVEFA